MSRRVLIAISLFVLGCKDEAGSAAELKERKANPKPVVQKENVKIVSSPVPPGIHLPCTQIVDPVAVSAAIGQPIEVKEDKLFDAEAVASCAIHTTGKPLTAAEQKKKFDTEGLKIGVMAGDELCRVTVYGWVPYPEVAAAKKACEERGEETNNELGDLTCIKEFEAGADYKHVYNVYDPDSKTRLQVNPGPSVVDEAVVKGCAKAFATLIGPDQLKVP
jgi:hypothetical protein